MGLEEPTWSVAVVVPGGVQAHKQMLHWADAQDLGAAKKISGETSRWLSQRGGRRQKKLGKVSLKHLVHGNHAGLVVVICSQDQSWYPMPEIYLQLWEWELIP